MVRGGMQQCQEGGEGTVTATGSEALPSKSFCPLLSRRNCQLHLKSCTCVIGVRLGDLVPAINEQSREQFLWCEFQVKLGKCPKILHGFLFCQTSCTFCQYMPKHFFEKHTFPKFYTFPYFIQTRSFTYSGILKSIIHTETVWHFASKMKQHKSQGYYTYRGFRQGRIGVGRHGSSVP